MPTYYELLTLHPKATSREIYAMFRQHIVAYRPTITIDRLTSDKNFQLYLDAYLTLASEGRAQYNDLLAQYKKNHDDQHAQSSPPSPHPFDDLSAHEKNILLARVAFWRRENSEALHMLRQLLETERNCAPAWALVGDIFLTVGHIEDGVLAYQHAVKYAPKEARYRQRLSHAEAVQQGKVELRIELSPEEELINEQRASRWRFMTLISLFGVLAIIFSFFYPVNQSLMNGYLYISWKHMVIQAAGMMILMAGLAYGRVIDPFDEVMIFSTTPAFDRGRLNNYPMGLILFVLSVACFWTALVGFIIMAILEEEWPLSAAILLGSCLVVLTGFTYLLYSSGLPYGVTAVFGGNLLAVAGMVGWWGGSFGISRFT